MFVPDSTVAGPLPPVSPAALGVPAETILQAGQLRCEELQLGLGLLGGGDGGAGRVMTILPHTVEI